MSQSTHSPGTDKPVRYKRKLRNYMIDRRFQLKYTMMIMGLSLVLIAALGGLLYQQVLATVDENAKATEGTAAAARASADAAKVSKENSEIIIAQALADDYFQDPEVTKKFVEDMKKPVEDVKAKAVAMDEQARNMEEESGEFRKRARQLPLLLALFGITFLLFLFLISIYTTHKIAGPMYKIKKLMSEVDGDSLHIAGALRRGDEMWELFDAFNSMIERLRKHQSDEARRLARLIDELEKAENDEARKEIAGQLSAFKDQMEAALE
jgi:nitrogen fixation/metabolism regulation signal transduction histidine kinase